MNDERKPYEPPAFTTIEFAGFDPPIVATVSATFTTPEDREPPRCSQCGREPPTHSKGCPRIITDRAIEADVFHELARSVTPELAIILKALAYGATLTVETGTFGFRAELRAGSRTARVADLQLSACIMGLAAAWERS